MRDKEPRPDPAMHPPGFRDYADDTRREDDEAPWADDEARLPLDTEYLQPEFTVERWNDETFSPIDDPLPRPYPAAAAPGDATGAGERRERRGLLGTLATAAAACAVGIGAGLAWDDLKARLAWPGPPAAAAASAQVQAPVAADRAPPPQAPGAEASAASLRAPDAPTAAPQVAPQVAPQPAPARPAAGALAVEAPAARAIPRAERAPAAPASRPAESASASAAANAYEASAVVRSPARPPSDCTDAGTLAGQLGCDNPAIAQAHRRMVGAYGRALDAGAPQEQLNADQARWLSLRARAAQASNDALLGAYQQRIQELEAVGRSPLRSAN